MSSGVGRSLKLWSIWRGTDFGEVQDRRGVLGRLISILRGHIYLPSAAAILQPNLTKTYEKTDDTENFSMRSYRQKLAQWQYLRREDEGKGSMKGKGSGAAANSQTGSSKTQISHPPATNGVPLQVGGSDQAATAQSGFNFDAGQDMGQFDQFGGGDGQFGQLQYDNMQDCQDPDCQGERYPNHNFHWPPPTRWSELLLPRLLVMRVSSIKFCG